MTINSSHIQNKIWKTIKIPHKNIPQVTLKIKKTPTTCKLVVAGAASSGKMQPNPGNMRVSQSHASMQTAPTLLVQAEKRCFACSKHFILEGTLRSARVRLDSKV